MLRSAWAHGMSEKAEKRKTARALKNEKIIRDKFIQECLKRPDGRAFFWWLLQIGKFGAQPFAIQETLMAFGCGELNVGQQIFAAIIEADPAGFLRMQQEINDARRTNHPSDDAGDSSDDSAGDTASRASNDTFDAGSSEGS
jgi:hypothetical protein